MKIFVLLFIFLNLIADNSYSFRVASGKATTSNLSEVFSGQIDLPAHDYRVLAFDGGYLLKRNLLDLPLDLYINGGLAYYDEDNVHDNVFEGTIYIKFIYNIDFWNNRVRIGLGEGISYTSGYLQVEYEEAIADNDGHSKYLNYLDISLDFDIGRLVNYKPLFDTYFGWGIRHRSGVFGLLNDVEEGGANYNTLYLEKTF